MLEENVKQYRVLVNKEYISNCVAYDIEAGYAIQEVPVIKTTTNIRAKNELHIVEDEAIPEFEYKDVKIEGSITLASVDEQR